MAVCQPTPKSERPGPPSPPRLPPDGRSRALARSFSDARRRSPRSARSRGRPRSRHRRSAKGAWPTPGPRPARRGPGSAPDPALAVADRPRSTRATQTTSAVLSTCSPDHRPPRVEHRPRTRACPSNAVAPSLRCFTVRCLLFAAGKQPQNGEALGHGGGSMAGSPDSPRPRCIALTQFTRGSTALARNVSGR